VVSSFSPKSVSEWTEWTFILRLFLPALLGTSWTFFFFSFPLPDPLRLPQVSSLHFTGFRSPFEDQRPLLSDAYLLLVFLFLGARSSEIQFELPLGIHLLFFSRRAQPLCFLHKGIRPPFFNMFRAQGSAVVLAYPFVFSCQRTCGVFSIFFAAARGEKSRVTDFFLLLAADEIVGRAPPPPTKPPPPPTHRPSFRCPLIFFPTFCSPSPPSCRLSSFVIGQLVVRFFSSLPPIIDKEKVLFEM